MGQTGEPLMRKTYGNVTAVLKGMVVFAFFFFVILSFYNGPNLALLPCLGRVEALGVLGVATAAAAGMSLVIGRAPRAFSVSLPRTFAAGGVLLLPMLVNGLLEHFGLVAAALVLPCAIGSWILFGAALALVLSACASYLYCTSFDSTPLVIAAGACMGTALFAFLVLLQSPLACLAIATVIYFAGCAASAAFSLELDQDEDKISRRRHESRIQRGGMSVPAVFSTFIQVVVLGYILASPQGLSPLAAGQVFCVGCLVAAFLFVFTSVRLKWVSDLQGVCLLTMPVVLAGLVLFQVLGSLGAVLCYGLIVVALSYHYFIYWQDSVCMSHDSVAGQCARHARSHAAVFASVLLGLIAHIAVIMSGADRGEMELLANSVLAVALCVAFLVFAIAARSFTEEGRRPQVAGASCAVGEPVGLAGGTCDVAGPGAPDRASDGASSRFDRRCGELIECFALTDREAEVLVLLAKGRNAEHIMGALSISRSTAKSHISSIYRKMGVHKQQELISLVEEKG